MNNKEDNQLPLFESRSTNGEAASNASSQLRDSNNSSFSKYIVYVDESGDHSLQSIDRQYPMFVLALCVFHKRHYSEVIVPALEKFKFNHFGHDQVVLHEHEIRKEKGVFNFFRSKAEKQKFMEELTKIVEVGNFVLISCCIDKVKLNKQGDTSSNPYHLALEFCLDRLFHFLCEKGEHKKRTTIVVECRGRKEDRELELEFRRICDGNNRIGKQFPFEVVFSDKRAMSSGLQLADLVARPIGLSRLRPDQENRAFEVLRKKFYCRDGRAAVGRNYEGVGLGIIPSPKSEKPR